MNGEQSYSILSEEEATDTIYQISRFKVAELKDLARSLGLRLTGKKQDIVDRIVQFFEYGRHYSDNLRLMTVRTLVLKKQNHDSLPPFQVLYNSIRSGAYSFTDTPNQYSSSNALSTRGQNDSMAYMEHSLYFRNSPFYRPIRLVHGSPQVALPTRSRSVCEYNFVLNTEENALLNMEDKKFRFYLLCGVQGNKSPSTIDALLSFPNPVEIHVNGRTIQENVKGIKGKPGTAKPADITQYLNPFPKANKIQMVYTTTDDTFLLYLYIVEVVPCQDIIQEIVQRPHIHKNATIHVIKNNSTNDDDDDDIILSTSSVTLKDPISYTRMKYPAQSIYCTHIECFDCLIFLESQLQLPTWVCPNCHKPVRIEDIAISDYFLEVLEKVPESTEHILINEEGEWEIEPSSSTPPRSKSNSSFNKNMSITPEKPAKVEEIEIVSIDSDSGSDTEVEVEPVSFNRVEEQNNGKSQPSMQTDSSTTFQGYIPGNLSLNQPLHAEDTTLSSYLAQDDSIPLSRLDPNNRHRSNRLLPLQLPTSYQDSQSNRDISYPLGSTTFQTQNNANAISSKPSSDMTSTITAGDFGISVPNENPGEVPSRPTEPEVLDDEDDDISLPIRIRRSKPPIISEAVDTPGASNTPTEASSDQSVVIGKDFGGITDSVPPLPAFDIGSNSNFNRIDQNDMRAVDGNTHSAVDVNALRSDKVLTNHVQHNGSQFDSVVPNSLNITQANPTPLPPPKFPQHFIEALEFQEQQRNQRREQQERHELMKNQLQENLNHQRVSFDTSQTSGPVSEPNHQYQSIAGIDDLPPAPTSHLDNSSKENEVRLTDINEPPSKQQKVTPASANVLGNLNPSDKNRQSYLDTENSQSNLSPLNGKITNLMIETPMSNRVRNNIDEQ